MAPHLPHKHNGPNVANSNICSAIKNTTIYEPDIARWATSDSYPSICCDVDLWPFDSKNVVGMYPAPGK